MFLEQRKRYSSEEEDDYEFDIKPMKESKKFYKKKHNKYTIVDFGCSLFPSRNLFKNQSELI